MDMTYRVMGVYLPGKTPSSPAAPAMAHTAPLRPGWASQSQESWKTAHSPSVGPCTPLACCSLLVPCPGTCRKLKCDWHHGHSMTWRCHTQQAGKSGWLFPQFLQQCGRDGRHQSQSRESPCSSRSSNRSQSRESLCSSRSFNRADTSEAGTLVRLCHFPPECDPATVPGQVRRYVHAQGRVAQVLSPPTSTTCNHLQSLHWEHTVPQVPSALPSSSTSVDELPPV